MSRANSSSSRYAGNPLRLDLESISWLDMLSCVCFLVVVSGFGLRLYQHRPKGGTHDVEWTLLSYRDVIYYPTQAIADGVNPYDSSTADPDSYLNEYPVADHFPLYSPVLLVLFLPLTMLPINMSMAAYFVLMVAAFPLFVWLVYAVIGRQPTMAGVFGISALLMLSQVGRGAINSGQISIFLALATLGILHVGDRHRSGSSALYVFSLTKPTFGGPVAMLMAAAGFIRSSLPGLAIGGLVTLLGMLIVFSVTNTSDGKDIIGGNVSYFHGSAAVTTNAFSRVECAATLEYLLGRDLPRGMSMVIALLMIGISAIALRKSATMASREKPCFAASPAGALVIVTMYVCYYHNVYDLLLLLVPIMSMRFHRHNEFRDYTPFLRGMLVALLLIPFVNVCWGLSFRHLGAQLLGDSSSVRHMLTNVARIAAVINGTALLAVWTIFVAKTLSLPQKRCLHG